MLLLKFVYKHFKKNSRFKTLISSFHIHVFSIRIRTSGMRFGQNLKHVKNISRLNVRKITKNNNWFLIEMQKISFFSLLEAS